MGKTNYPISRFADTVGDGSGSIEGNTNSSVTPLLLKVTPGPTETFKISRMIVYIEDTSIDSGGYGGISALTNGIHIHVIRNSGEAGEVILWDITGRDIKKNTHWKSLCHDEIYSNYGTGTESLSYRYTFTNDGAPIIISGANKEEFRIILNDDLTGLQSHTFRIGMDDASR